MSITKTTAIAETMSELSTGVETSTRGDGAAGGGAAGRGGRDGGVISAVVMSTTLVQLLVFTSLSVTFATDKTAAAPVPPPTAVAFSRKLAIILV